MYYPRDVVITSKRMLLVADSGDHYIQEFTMDGKCVSCIGSKGKGQLQLCFPRSIAINKTTELNMVTTGYRS